MTENFKKAIEWAKKARRITFITHDGRAHPDETYTIGLALALLRKAGAGFDFTVLRLSQAKLPDVLNYGEFMIDTGKTYDGVCHLDHHQMPPSKHNCSLSLLVDSWAPELLEYSYFRSFVERVAIQDTEGLLAYRAKHKIKNNIKHLLLGEHMLVDHFMFSPKTKVQEIASWLLQNVINLSKDISNLDEWVEEHKIIETIEGIKIMFLTGSPDSENPALVKHLFKSLGKHAATDNVMMSVAQPDPKKSFYSFYRYHPEPKYIDFNLCKGMQAVVNSSIPIAGYSMHANTQDKDQIRAIIKKSIVAYGVEPPQSEYKGNDFNTQD